MSSIRSNLRRFYGRHLESGEKVIAAAEATFAGAGALTATGVGIGVLCGALAWTLLNTAALWPLMVLGGFTGVIGGMLVATRKARAASEPGAALVRLVLTDRRLLTLRRRWAIRLAPLRSHRLEDIERMDSSPAAIGRYRRLAVTLRSGSTMQLVVAGAHDFGELWEGQRQAPGDPAASEVEPTG